MKLVSIYEHMETGASKVPVGQNCKIIFRHSIRGKIESGVRREVSITDEGIELCKSFGRNCNMTSDMLLQVLAYETFRLVKISF